MPAIIGLVPVPQKLQSHEYGLGSGNLAGRNLPLDDSAFEDSPFDGSAFEGSPFCIQTTLNLTS